MPTWRAGVRARDGRCTRGRERALLLDCGPRTTLAPQGCPGQDQTSQGGLERLVGPDPGPPRREPARWVRGPLCSSSPDSQRGLCLFPPPLYVAFSSGQRAGFLFVLSEQTGPNMQHLSKHMA